VQGCKKGDANSTCEGKCSNDYGPAGRNACESGKPGALVQYTCPRYILFSDEMKQAAIDDGYEGKLNYAVVGHDQDSEELDKGLPDACCQCYQLVYEAPTYLYTGSTITPPKPLIVQSINTAASGGKGFDVFMGAGGMGAFNACGAVSAKALSSDAPPMYTAYPGIGQASSGGVKPGPDSLKCDSNGKLTEEMIAADSCQQKITEACNQITAKNSTVQEQTRRSCIQSNQGASYYHENWNVYAKRVNCPAHLTQVTGCKLAKDSKVGDPEPNVQTAAQAKSAGFASGRHTTTMQDCCMGTCQWANNVKGTTVEGYNSFYSCREDGTVVSKKQ
jgi:hypothetical protein